MVVQRTEALRLVRVLFGGNSFSQAAEAQGGRTTGFDLLRICLAVSVVLFHSIGVSYGQNANLAAWAGPFRPLCMLLLPMFFSLSGYLVAGSLERTKGLHRFLGLRAIRIVPALAVETLLCALLLGTALTTLPLSKYFTSSEFWSYFLNIGGDIHYTLPGVYHGLPIPDIVNFSLWTVPYELECYVALAGLALLGITRNRWLLLGATLAICMAAPFIFTTEGFLGRPTGKMLVLCFLCGVTFFNVRERLPHNPILFVVALGVALFYLKGLQFEFWAAPFVAYVVAYLGLLRAPHIPGLMDGDYSYGLYLFAFPLQQLQAYLFPAHREWYWNCLFAICTGMAYAAFSWSVVEKPILGHRKLILNSMDNFIGMAVRPVRRLVQGS